MEKQRRRIMSSPRSWGDLPPSTWAAPPDSLLSVDCGQCLGRGNKGVSGLRRDFPNTDNDDGDGPTSGLPTMNRAHSHAKFAISTQGWTFDSVLKHGNNFLPIERIKATSAAADVQRAIERYEDEGIPIIIEGWHEHEKWPQDMFSLDFFRQNVSSNMINVRNVHNLKDSLLALPDFIDHCRNSPPCAAADEEVRFYGKDAECPPDWKAWLETAGVLPASLLWDGPQDYFRYRPEKTKVETLMCYLGIGDTFTAAHKDLCASSGHNLMCYTENNGASYWFMTKGSDAPDVNEYFQRLGQELDHETHVVSLDELKQAPFEVYVGKQVLGDLVLVPPRSCHQVVNFGGITLKTSWSRMSLKGLSTALYHELPLYQRVCRFETYRVKNTIFCSLRRQTAELQEINGRLKVKKAHSKSLSAKELEKKMRDEQGHIAKSLATLLGLFSDVLAEEYSPHWKGMSQSSAELDPLDEDSPVLCDFCGCDVFQSYLECLQCVPDGNPSSGERGTYTICPPCYVEGRSCRCLAMEKKQVFSFDFLLKVQQSTAKALNFTGPQRTLFQPHPSHQSIFVAACYLHDQRARPPTVCKIDKDRAHGLSCSACHNSKCFAHLLTNYKMHASDGLLIQRTDEKTHANYHRFHMTLKNDYPARIPLIKDCQRLGGAPDASLAPYLRTHVALQHNVCRPVFFSLSTPGFYDERIQDCDEVVAELDSDPERDDMQEVESLTEMSTLTPCPSSIVLPDDVATNAINKPPREVSNITTHGLGLAIDKSSISRASSVFMDYVAVPQRRRRLFSPDDEPQLQPLTGAEVPTKFGSMAKKRKVGAPVRGKGRERDDSSLFPPDPKSAARAKETRPLTNTSKQWSCDSDEASGSGDDSPNEVVSRQHLYRKGKPRAHLPEGNKPSKRKRTEAISREDSFSSHLATALNIASTMEEAEVEPERPALTARRKQQPRKAATALLPASLGSSSNPIPLLKRRKVDPVEKVGRSSLSNPRPEAVGSDPRGAEATRKPVSRKRAQTSSHSEESLSTPPPKPPITSKRQNVLITRKNSGTSRAAPIPTNLFVVPDSRTTNASSESTLSRSSVLKHRFRTGLLVTFKDGRETTSISSPFISTELNTPSSSVGRAKECVSEDLASVLNRANPQSTTADRLETKQSGPTNTRMVTGNSTWNFSFAPSANQESAEEHLPQATLISATSSGTDFNGAGSGVPVALSLHITMQQTPQQYVPVPAVPTHPPIASQTPPSSQPDQNPTYESPDEHDNQPMAPAYIPYSERYSSRPQSSPSRYPEPYSATRRTSEPDPRHPPSSYRRRNTYDRPPFTPPLQAYPPRTYHRGPMRETPIPRRNTFPYPSDSSFSYHNHPRRRVVVELPEAEYPRYSDPSPGHDIRGDQRGRVHQPRGLALHPDPRQDPAPHGPPRPQAAPVPLINRLEPRVEINEVGSGGLADSQASHGNSQPVKTIYERQDSAPEQQSTSSRQGGSTVPAVTSHPDGGRRSWTWAQKPTNQFSNSRGGPAGRGRPYGLQRRFDGAKPALDEMRQPWPTPAPAPPAPAPAMPPPAQASPFHPPLPPALPRLSPSPPPPPRRAAPPPSGSRQGSVIDAQDWEATYEMNEDDPGKRNARIGPPSRRGSTGPRSIGLNKTRQPPVPRVVSPRAGADSTYSDVEQPNPWM